MSLFIDFQNWRRQDPFSGLNTEMPGGFRDNFSCLMFHLVSKADPQNRHRLKIAFPKHVALWEWWTEQTTEPTPEQIKAKAEKLESEP